ncbi:MAG: hypothetical protein WDN28_17400 [Chthoniobacter sp.]
MNLRLFACAVLMVAFAACQAPYKKRDEEDKIKMKDQSHDQSFQAFVGPPAHGGQQA